MIPVLEKEVNDGASFAGLRQIYHSLILAAWFKRKMKASLLARAYVNKKSVKGLGWSTDNSQQSAVSGQQSEKNSAILASSADSRQLTADLNPEQIWNAYVDTFKKGVYNFIREET
ncbi:MAG: hypothetical protein HQL18_03365, partial [Candidatus Omnitrophica bacterium]|nr:hypothetical protein [Candidatus Omnitrophota bacterium]